MKSTVDILEGSTFVTSDMIGDMDGTPITPHGFFAQDTRFLSRWKLTVDGFSPAPLSTDDLHYNAAQFFLAVSTGRQYIDSPISLVRRRGVGESMREEISIINHSPEKKSLAVKLEVAADFADLFEVKDLLQKKGEFYNVIEPKKLTLGYRREDYVRETWIQVSGDGTAKITPDSLSFKVELPPNGKWSVTIDVLPVVDVERPPKEVRVSSALFRDVAPDEWQQRAPKLESDWRPIERIYRRSILDLVSLRLPLGLTGDQELAAAGLPWFMAPFGRDSLIVSYQALPFIPELAEKTLSTLAFFQGKRMDDFRDEEPGKILHEMRFGELTAFEERPHSPYYGTADATLLWLILLDEYERWSGRADVVRKFKDNAKAALEWIDKYGDRDGDGYVEYERRNKETGLENQCWKDSWNSILYSDGRLASLPRATCELQGYTYDAKVRCARLARDIWGDAALADRLEREAADLKKRFNDDFWLEDRGYYALALDGEKKQVDSLTSNIGHLLWSGIVDDDKAPLVVQHLMGDRLFSGWGVRTMAAGEGGYNPIGYHVGTVWPHDNSFAAMGLRRYGYGEEAARISEGILLAATFFNDRLPEAFAGYNRDETHYPAEYPTACSPQAWATGAPLLLIRSLLALEPRGSMLSFDPVLPDMIGRLNVEGIPGQWGLVDAGLDTAQAMLSVLDSAAQVAPAPVSEVLRRISSRIDPEHARGMRTSVRFDLSGLEKWRIAIDNGRATAGPSEETADCVIETRPEILEAILGGEQNIRTAYLAGKVKVHGDMALARWLIAA